jgi:hypothetical protein
MIDSGKLPVTDRKGKIPAEDTKCALCSNLIWSVFISLFAVLFYRTEFKFVALHDWDTIIETKTSNELERAWKLLSDFDNYKKWNTFTTFVGTSNQIPMIHEPVTLHVNLGLPYPFSILSKSKSNLTLDFVWKDYQPRKHRLCWGIQGNSIANIFLTSYRCCELRFIENVGVQVKHSDLNEGIFAPLVEFMYVDVIEEGFHQMTHDMQSYLSA